jgi:hypothetical protein
MVEFIGSVLWEHARLLDEEKKEEVRREETGGEDGRKSARARQARFWPDKALRTGAKGRARAGRGVESFPLA